MVGTVASSASASTSIASVASVAPVAIVLPATSQQVLEESSKLWRSSGQGEPGKEESDRQLHVKEVSGEPVTLTWEIIVQTLLEFLTNKKQENICAPNSMHHSLFL